LSMLIQSLEKISAMELQVSPTQNAGAVELTSVLDELRVLIESAYHDSEMEIEWQIQESLPRVWADRYGLIQVFLNLAKNSQRAMQRSETKRLSVSASDAGSTVVVRFEDTGVGISAPENLFRPFQRGADSSGLGLYVSRAIIHSFGGELLYERRPRGCCFVVVLPSLSTSSKEVINA
jgi:two-component system, LuxR family, sensor kinase FixL